MSVPNRFPAVRAQIVFLLHVLPVGYGYYSHLCLLPARDEPDHPAIHQTFRLSCFFACTQPHRDMPEVQPFVASRFSWEVQE